MILCDSDIDRAILDGQLGIEPYEIANLQPASYDLTLGDSFGGFLNLENRYVQSDLGYLIEPVIDPRKDPSTQMYKRTILDGESIELKAGEFMLGTTLERVSINSNHQGQLDGKSSLARIGLLVHITGGFIDPGFVGEITLEFYNATRQTIILWPGMKIAQISFSRLSDHSVRPYGTPGLGSKYQGQSGATASRIQKNFTEVP
jgi:dCTP deaminase